MKAKKTGRIPSVERGPTVTVEECLKVAGIYMHVMLISAEQRMKQKLLDSASSGTTPECNGRGWMNAETFMTWFQRLVNN